MNDKTKILLEKADRLIALKKPESKQKKTHKKKVVRFQGDQPGRTWY